MSTRNRVDIAAMLADKTTAAEQERKSPRAEPDPTPARAEQPQSRRPAKRAPARPRPRSDDPKWKQCEPRTFYVWPDSIDELQQLARRLQRARPRGAGERITMATLVRVAIARLLEVGDLLAGVDEDELLDSYRSHTQPKKRKT